MIRNRYLMSFTILEVLISLIVMGIIISLTYSFVTLVQKQLLNYQKETEALMHYNIFNSTLLTDLYIANDSSFNDETIEISTFNGKKITYKLIDSQIIRIHETTIDTFAINFSSIRPVQNLNSVKGISLDIPIINQTIKTNYLKEESSAKIVNALMEQ